MIVKHYIFYTCKKVRLSFNYPVFVHVTTQALNAKRTEIYFSRIHIEFLIKQNSTHTNSGRTRNVFDLFSKTSCDILKSFLLLSGYLMSNFILISNN